LFQTAVRDAAEGRLALKVENAGLAQLRQDLRLAQTRRDAVIAAGVLWLSGMIWLALIDRYQWFGWLQLCAAIAVVVRCRSSKAQIE
jgi:hypothetical protein